VNGLKTDNVGNTARLSDQGKSDWVYMQNAWGRREVLTDLGRSVRQTVLQGGDVTGQ